jgi:hypothetical protein
MNEAASSVEPEVKTRFATVDDAMTFHKVDTVIYQPRRNHVHRSQRLR